MLNSLNKLTGKVFFTRAHARVLYIYAAIYEREACLSAGFMKHARKWLNELSNYNKTILRLRRCKLSCQGLTKTMSLLFLVFLGVLLLFQIARPDPVNARPDPIQEIRQKKARKNLADKDFGKKLKAIDEVRESKDKKAVTGLIQILKNDKSPVARQYASDALAEIKDESAIVPILEQYRIESDPAVRIGLVGALRGIGGEEALSALITIYEEDTYTGVKVMVLNSLDVFNSESVINLLMGAARDDDSSIRRSAIRALGDKKDKTVVIEALDDEDENVRREAVDALGKMRDIDRLRSLENSENEEVREKAKFHLERLRK